MAINTIKATMQMRRGMEENFDPDQMTAGEWAVSTDKKYVRMCFAPGLCLRMATYESFEEDMLEIQTILAACQDIQTAVEKFEQLAEQHKNDAAASAEAAEDSAALSESWAVGNTGVREGEETNNSKYWSEMAQRVVEAVSMGGIIPMGTITFANLPETGMKAGYMYNISDAFTSDTRFEDGGNIYYSAGANVYYTAGGKWDVLAGVQTAATTSADGLMSATDKAKLDGINASLAYESKSYTVLNGIRFAFIRFGMIVQVLVDNPSDHDVLTKNTWEVAITAPFLPRTYQYHVCPQSDYNPELINFSIQTDGVIKMRPQVDVPESGLIRCNFMYICGI